jgi:hypothetical protein
MPGFAYDCRQSLAAGKSAGFLTASWAIVDRREGEAGELGVTRTGQNLPVGRAKCLPQSRRLRLALDCPVRVRTRIRASALDAGRNYNMVIVFAEGA